MGATTKTPITVWHIDLDDPGFLHAAHLDVLSADEVARAAAFHTNLLANRWRAARAALRWILSLELQQNPVDIRFGYGQYGKPYVRLPAAEFHSFNLSHSRNRALVALSSTGSGSIGVDIESIRDDDSVMDLINQIMTPAELQRYTQFPLARRKAEVYKLWTAKEAYLKSTGQGLGGNMRQVILSDTDSAVPRIATAGQDLTQRFLYRIDNIVGFSAALVHDGDQPSQFEFIAYGP